MNLKIFTAISVTGLAILLIATFILNTQLCRIQEIDMGPLVSDMYNENAAIMLWAMNNMDTGKPGKMQIPESWADIMSIDNETLCIHSSTTQDNNGRFMYELPGLLDQGQMIIDAIKTGKPSHRDTGKYMVAILPGPGNTSLVGLKDKAWEKKIVSTRESGIKTDTSQLQLYIFTFLGAGVCVVILLALVISTWVTRTMSKVLGSFEALSLGDLDTMPPKAKGKEMSSFLDSFLRIKTSLSIGLKKLGER
ncbi:MAG: hypothetical protein U9P80_05010 [Thermodesulfobacteriota bacterium]|nr:hypothetical protein [Thermodesulfobacteriota bacterium]